MRRIELTRRLVRDDPLEPSRPILDALAIDAKWPEFALESTSGNEPLVLDLTSVSYLNHDCLLYMGALLRQRSILGGKTIFALPTDYPQVLDYLRAWRFPQFVESLTSAPFEDSLTKESRELYGRALETLPRYVQAISAPGGGVEELLLTTHFAITPITMLSNPLKAATLEQEKWLEKQLVAILDIYLKGEGERIATKVILESVYNAASHPQATLAFTSSQFVDAKLSKRPRSYLEISVWDDGDAIATTLLRRLNDGKSITSPAFGAVDEEFLVTLAREGSRDVVRRIQPRRDHLHSNFAWLTVSAFLLGVTSVPERGANRAKNSVGPPVSESSYGSPRELPANMNDYGGLGLFYIRRNVIDQFGGKLRYMSGNYRMTMTSGGRPNTYTVLLQHRPDRSWPLQGNLLVAEIPDQRQQRKVL